MKSLHKPQIFNIYLLLLALQLYRAFCLQCLKPPEQPTKTHLKCAPASVTRKQIKVFFMLSTRAQQYVPIVHLLSKLICHVPKDRKIVICTQLE